LAPALDAVRPGATCEEIEATWRKVINKAGYEKKSRIGYSIGIDVPPDWGEHTASVRQGDRTVMEPNMTFHMITGMFMDNWGCLLSGTFRVTDRCCEILSDLPRKLFVKK
jgi:ectoine hydrolase